MTKKQVMDAVNKAKQGDSNLTKEVLSLEGMSSEKNRHLLNNLAAGKKYLEIGTHKGSTLASACYNNGAKGLAYDDYRRFGVHLKEVKLLIKRLNLNAKIIDDDGFNHKSREKYDVIFYDGDHSYENSKKAIDFFSKHVKKGGILIMDDYEYPDVMKAVNESELDRVLLRADSRNKKPVKWDMEGWYNGIAILLI